MTTQPRFHLMTCMALFASACVLGLGMYLFLQGTARQARAAEGAEKITKVRASLDALALANQDYQKLLAQIQWRPGVELRREVVDLSANVSGSELNRINELFAVTYSGKGYFSLESFRLEDGPLDTRPNGTGFSLKVSVRGDNILVLEPK